MSEAKHTPGPWEVREEAVGNRVFRRLIHKNYPNGMGHKPIATLHDGFTCFEADARLISAAPDLLAACRVGVMALLLERGAAHIGDAKIFLDLATAAIKKATGG